MGRDIGESNILENESNLLLYFFFPVDIGLSLILIIQQQKLSIPLFENHRNYLVTMIDFCYLVLSLHTT